MSPIRLRSITVTKEETAILRVALAALLERTDTLSEEGRAVARTLAAKTEDVLSTFPKEVN